MTPLPSSSAKSNVTPIARLEKRQKSPKGLSRKSQMERKPSKLKRGPVGHASSEQKAKALREGSRVLEFAFGFEENGVIDPAHITPRTVGGCDHEDCIVPLPRRIHRAYDEGEFSILEYLTLEEQAHAVKHAGILGALKRTTGETYVPERLLRVVSDDGETS